MSYTELRANFVKGKKEYSCEWCNQRIEKGLTHFVRAYIFDNEFNTGRMHIECEEAMRKAPRDELEDGWSPGDYERGESVSRHSL